MTEEYLRKVMIEPTNICNLQCPACLTGSSYFNNKPRGSMTFQQFRRIVDLNKDFIQHINLWGYGEPFLAPDIMKMINYAGENNICVSIHTNGTILSKKVLNQFKDIKSRLAITFSIDGVTQESYGYYRRGGNLKEVLNNLFYLIDLKRKYKLLNIRIVWQFLIMRTNEYEIPSVCELARKIGVDHLKFRTIILGKNDPSYNDFAPQKYKKFLTKERNNRWDDGKNYRIIKNGECDFINPGSLFVLWTGDVTPCCRIGNYIVGNAWEKSLVDIWNTKKHKRFRNDYNDGTNSSCNECKFAKNPKVYVKKFNS